MFKNSKLTLNKDIQCLVDKGYLLIKKLHLNSQIPYKKPKNGKLSNEEKKKNRHLAKNRVIGDALGQRK
ncbi:hypothetical protein DP116_23915 [Brasilonema bromeliae SPC951]|uniref:DDE Tnp4 domain-containing protein n=1 Tax=Brasilonema bromeliae SPC951 TaxID=385972 RepID=A0ABX1PCW7_9CYAN|nr:hypothetical protein [Brasilonema bromeliae SPC951]